MSAPPIKAVFFDIGNVLLRFDVADIFDKLSRYLGRDRLQIARRLGDPRRIAALERGEVSTADLYRIFREELGFKGRFARFRTLWCDHFTLQRHTSEMLKKVARRMPTYLLSNTHALHYDFICENYAFPRHVHGAVLSHELGMRKPEARIFAAALRMAKVKQPAQALFIDDLERNVRAARRAGLQAILYRGSEDLHRRLKALGVLR